MTARRGGRAVLDPHHRRRPGRADPGALHLDLRRHDRHPCARRSTAAPPTSARISARSCCRSRKALLIGTARDDRLRAHSRHAHSRPSSRSPLVVGAVGFTLLSGERKAGATPRPAQATSRHGHGSRRPGAMRRRGQRGHGARFHAHRAAAGRRAFRSCEQAFSRRDAERGAGEGPPRALLRPGRRLPRHPAALQRSAAATSTYTILLAEVPVSQGRAAARAPARARDAGEPDRAVGIPYRDRQEVPAATSRRSGSPPRLKRLHCARRASRFMDADAAAELPHRLRAQEVCRRTSSASRRRAFSARPTWSSRFPGAREGSAARAADPEDRRDPAAAGIRRGFDPQPRARSWRRSSSGARRRRIRCC